MRPKATTLTAHELELMKILWRHETPVTVRDVYEEVRKSRPVAYTTVMTSMKTLEQKGHLTATLQDRAYLYRPARPKQQVISEMVRDFVNRVFNGSGRPLVLHMIEEEQLSEADLRDIARMRGEEAMTVSIWLRNVGAFGLQVALIVAAGALLARGFRIHAPRATLAYWRALLLACLLLPLCQPWRSVPPPAFDSAPMPVHARRTVVGRSREAGRSAGPPDPQPLEAVALLLLAGGIGARALWLTMGAFALGRMRRRGSLLVPLPPAIREAQTRIGTRATIYVSDGIAGPITFGVIDPVIMLPASVPEMAPPVQAAIAYHELLHVRRRDWVHEILEEVVRTILWFHPAVWWLIGRIQLSREQVVDQAVIRLTESRDRYIDALLTVALGTSPAALTPAPLFLRRSHLKKRVAQILQETTMTRHRLIASLTASAAALAVAATLAVRAFPLEAQAQRPAPAGAPVQIVKGGDHLLHAALPEYPRRAIEQRVEGDVLLDLSIDERGEVADARVLSGPDELRRAALESALQWHYSPSAVRSTSVQAVLRFSVPAGNAENVEFEKKQYAVAFMPGNDKRADQLSAGQRVERQMMEIQKALESPETTPQQKDELKFMLARAKADMAQSRASGDERNTFAGAPPRLAEIRTERVSQASVNEVMTQAGVRVGDTITEDTAKRVREIALSIDEHWRVGFRGDGKGGVILTIIAP